MTSLQKSTIQAEGEYKCSKWQTLAILFSKEELESLLSSLGECFFLPVAEPVIEGEECVSGNKIIKLYEEYLSWIRKTEELPPAEVRRFFSLGLTSSLDDVYVVPVGKDKVFVRPKRPIIQLQLYRCYLAPDGVFHPMILHPDSFSFGLQFAYPQIYEDPKTHQFHKVFLEEGFSNTQLYKKVVAWSRENTKPFNLQEGGVAPFRLGKKEENPLSYHLGLQKALFRVK